MAKMDTEMFAVKPVNEVFALRRTYSYPLHLRQSNGNRRKNSKQENRNVFCNNGCQSGIGTLLDIYA
jgi:hypothetical protein